MSKHNHNTSDKRARFRLFLFAGLTVIFVLLSFVFLTKNSQGAKERYESLIAVDEAGGDVEGALNELRTYIYSHMNTQIGSDTGIRPPIQLKGTYERLVAAQTEATNEDLYEEAQRDCERRNPNGFSGSNRLDCIEEYVDRNAADSETNEINDALYKFDFAPPFWSPDLAGWSIVASIFFAVSFLVQLIIVIRSKQLLSH